MSKKANEDRIVFKEYYLHLSLLNLNESIGILEGLVAQFHYYYSYVVISFLTHKKNKIDFKKVKKRIKEIEKAFDDLKSAVSSAERAVEEFLSEVKK